jgi:hypothetical protein
VRTAEIGPFIPVQPEPAQVDQLCLEILPPNPSRVQILNAESEPATGASRLEPGEEGGPGITEVEIPCRAGSEAAAQMRIESPLPVGRGRKGMGRGRVSSYSRSSSIRSTRASSAGRVSPVSADSRRSASSSPKS